MTWRGGEGVGILGRLFREGSSEKVTRAKGRAAVDEIRGALEIQDLVVLHRTGTFTLSENVSTAVFCKRDMGWPICYQDHSGCCIGNRLNWGARAAASRPVRRPFWLSGEEMIVPGAGFWQWREREMIKFWTSRETRCC